MPKNMHKKKTTARKAALKSKSKNPRAKKSSSKKNTAPRSSSDQALRDQLLALLKGDQAHADLDSSIGDWPIQLAGVKVANFPHTAWMLLEHMRLAQWDLLEFSRNPKYVARKWPEEYWPTSEAPSSEKAWTASLAAFKKDLKTVEALVTNPKTDLNWRIPWGDGQTILREILLVADHNSYHLGQLVMLRKSIGI
jgi:hypothetical protein